MKTFSEFMEAKKDLTPVDNKKIAPRDRDFAGGDFSLVRRHERSGMPKGTDLGRKDRVARNDEYRADRKKANIGQHQDKKNMVDASAAVMAKQITTINDKRDKLSNSNRKAMAKAVAHAMNRERIIKDTIGDPVNKPERGKSLKDNQKLKQRYATKQKYRVHKPDGTWTWGWKDK